MGDRVKRTVINPKSDGGFCLNLNINVNLNIKNENGESERVLKDDTGCLIS